jgi:hypothetical protein
MSYLSLKQRIWSSWLLSSGKLLQWSSIQLDVLHISRTCLSWWSMLMPSMSTMISQMHISMEFSCFAVFFTQCATTSTNCTKKDLRNISLTLRTTQTSCMFGVRSSTWFLKILQTHKLSIIRCSWQSFSCNRLLSHSSTLEFSRAWVISLQWSTQLLPTSRYSYSSSPF